MATVHDTCPRCGATQGVLGKELAVRPRVFRPIATYSFKCGSCDYIGPRVLSPREAELVVASGAKLSPWWRLAWGCAHFVRCNKN